MEPLLEIIGMYQLKMHILMMGKNDLEKINRMLYCVRLLSYFFRKNEKFLSQLLMELELKEDL
jgi:hypothetical protein